MSLKEIFPDVSLLTYIVRVQDFVGDIAEGL